MASLDSSVSEAYQQVRKDNGPNWLLIGYENNTTLKVVGTGSGGIEELANHVNDNDCFFGYLRVINKDDETSRTKFVFLTYKGENAPVMRKGKMSVHVSSVKQVLKDYAIEWNATEKAELTEEAIMKKLKAANY